MAKRPTEVVDQHPIKIDIEVALGDKNRWVCENYTLLEQKDTYIKALDAAGRVAYIYGTFIVKVLS